MFIYLNHTDLVGKGFLSFFISKQFNLEIHGKETTILSLSSVYKHIGLVREVLDSQFTLRLYEKDVLLEEIIVNLTDIPFLDEEIETKSVKINNSLCKGSFYIYKFRYDGFTDLENLFLKKKTTFLTKSCDNRRITYYNEFYSTDSLFRFGNKRQVKEFPFGWERRIVNNQLVYLDHNTKTTSSYIFNRNILPNLAIKSIFKIKLVANRKNTLLSVRNALLEKEYSLSDSELSVKFQDEIGDGVGVLRDFFSLLGTELKKDVRLECINGFIDLNHSYKFKSNEDCDFLRVLGIILGISLANKCTLNLKFSLNFLESITNLQFSICKIQDSTIQRSFLQIKRKEISLEEAKEIFCIDENVPTDLDTFINYLLKNTFYTPREEAYKVIQKSLSPFLRNEVNSYELFYLLYIPELSCDDLFRVINLQNCSPTTKEIKFLKEILKDDHLRMKFIIFATGESSVPEDDVIILEQCDIINYYFSATTCNKNVKMGMYDSKMDMERILIASIRNMEFRIV